MYHLNTKEIINALYLTNDEVEFILIPTMQSEQILCSKRILVYLFSYLQFLFLIYTIVDIILLLRSSTRYFSYPKFIVTL